MYETFGDSLFSQEMLIASLSYDSTSVITYLHQFQLLKILDCQKGDVYLYQFLVNPKENPECFIGAA